MRPALAILLAIQQLIGPVRMVGPSRVPVIVTPSNTIVIKSSAAADVGVDTVFFAFTPNATTDAIVVAVTTGANNTSTSPLTLVCDATSATNCASASTTVDTFTTLAAACQSEGGHQLCVTFSYVCSTSSGINHFGFRNAIGQVPNDTYRIYDIQGLPATCGVDTTACPSSVCPSATHAAPTGATMTTGTFTTGSANELIIAEFGDDNNCAPSWSGGSAGTGFTLDSITGVTCTSMLGITETQIYTSIQTSVTAAINVGNSTANALAFNTIVLK